MPALTTNELGAIKDGEQLRKDFDDQFALWVKDYYPETHPEAVAALKATAWHWFTRGSDQRLGDLVTRMQRAVADLPRQKAINKDYIA